MFAQLQLDFIIVIFFFSGIWCGYIGELANVLGFVAMARRCFLNQFWCHGVAALFSVSLSDVWQSWEGRRVSGEGQGRVAIIGRKLMW